MPPSQSRTSFFSKRPYLHRTIDSWKLFFLTLLFILLLIGALTWSNDIPWDGIF